MKTIIIVSTLLSGVVFLSGCEQPINQMQTPTSTAISTQSTNETAPLQTYSNVKWRFEVKYPSEYEIKIDVENESQLAFSIRKINDQEAAKNSDGICSNCVFRLNILTNFIGGTDEGSFKNPEEWIEFQKGIGSNYTQTTLAGNTAYASKELEIGRKSYLIFRKNGAMYDRYDFSVKENDSTAEIILSSFKFIEQ